MVQRFWYVSTWICFEGVVVFLCRKHEESTFVFCKISSFNGLLCSDELHWVTASKSHRVSVRVFEEFLFRYCT